MRRILSWDCLAAKRRWGRTTPTRRLRCWAPAVPLEDVTRQALAELGLDLEVGHVTDFSQIAAYGVMTTPALVVDGKVLSAGRSLTKGEAMELIKKARGL